MPQSEEELQRLLASYQKLRRTVRWHLFFLLGCIFAVLVLRRVLNYPPILSWILFAVPGVLFGADFIRLLACRFKLSRYRDEE